MFECIVIVTKYSHSDRTECAFLCCDKEVQMCELHCRELEAFKSEFGHCNVPTRYSVNPSLGHWCRAMRYSYNKMQQGQKPRSNLTQELIKCLEEIGFKWKVKETIESEVGHCNVRRKNSADPLC